MFCKRSQWFLQIPCISVLHQVRTQTNVTYRDGVRSEENANWNNCKLNNFRHEKLLLRACLSTNECWGKVHVWKMVCFKSRTNKQPSRLFPIGTNSLAKILSRFFLFMNSLILQASITPPASDVISKWTVHNFQSWVPHRHRNECSSFPAKWHKASQHHVLKLNLSNPHPRFISSVPGFCSLPQGHLSRLEGSFLCIKQLLHYSHSSY